MTTNREDTTMTTRRPTQMAQDALDTAQRKVELADARVQRAADRLECEVAWLHELVGELRGAAAALKAESDTPHPMNGPQNGEPQ